MSLADWVSSASSIWRSDRVSPNPMGMFDSSLARSYWYWPTSPAVTVIIGPSAPGASGWSRRMTTALAILVSEAMGTDASGPDCWANPSAGIATAPWPTTGQGRAGAVPGTVIRAARTETERGGGNGRVIRRTATTPAATRAITSKPTIDHQNRRWEGRRWALRSLRVRR